MRTPIVFGLAAALFSVSGMLMTEAPASAQTSSSSASRSKTAFKDVTKETGDKVLKILAGVTASDAIAYSVSYHGNVVVNDKSSISTCNTTSGQVLEFSFNKSSKDVDPLNVEAKILQLSFTIESQAPGQEKGRVVSFMASADGADGSGLFINGIEETSPPKGMPTASTLKNTLSQVAAYGRLDKTSQSLNRPAHAARFTEAVEENIAQNLLDPVAAMRLIFAGFAGRDAKIGDTLTFDSILSTDTAGAAPCAYSVSLKAEKALSAGTEAEAILFSITATPKDGAVMNLANGVTCKPPTLTGEALIELKRGLALKVSVEGSYEGSGVSGTIHMRVDLNEKKK